MKPKRGRPRQNLTVNYWLHLRKDTAARLRERIVKGKRSEFVSDAIEAKLRILDYWESTGT